MCWRKDLNIPCQSNHQIGLLSALFVFKAKFSIITMVKLLCHWNYFNDISEWLGKGMGALSVLKFIRLYQMYSVSSSSILSAPPCIVNDNDRYKIKAPLILVYSLWKRKPRTQIWKNPRFLRVYRAIMRGAFVLLDIRMMFWTLFTLINTCRHVSQHLKLILRWKNQIHAF